MAIRGDPENVRVVDLVDLALNDPLPAIDAANEVLAAPESAPQAVVALRARGLARRKLGEFEDSVRDLSEAQDRADEIGDNELWAGASLTLAGTMVFQGRVDEAKGLLERCIERADGETRAEAIQQLGATCAQAGELDEAVDHFARALPLIREFDRPAWEADLLGNRGVTNIYRGEFDEAIADLDIAIEILADHGPSLFSMHRDNKAYALQLRGDIAEAVDLYEENERYQQEHDLPTLMYSQRCTAYLAAGMFEDAMQLAQKAHRFHREARAVLGAIESLLPGAEAALALGETEFADQLAGAAINLDTEDAFPVLTARARLTQIEARLRSGSTSPDDAHQAGDLFALTDKRDSAAAVRSLLVGAAVATTHQQDGVARSMLAQAESSIGNVPVHVRIEHCTMLARSLAQQNNDFIGTVEEGLLAFDELISGVTSYDIRYKAARHAEQLAELGIGHLVTNDRYAEAVAMIERVRSAALRLGGVTETNPPSHNRLASDESYLVWTEHQDRVICLHATKGQVSHHDCGDRQTVTDAVERHRSTHRQLAHRANLSPRSHTELQAVAAAVDGDLAALLLPDQLDDRVILNPSALLRPVLWGALRGLSERCFTVSPSLAVAGRALPIEISTVAVLGARELPHVAPEVTAIAEAWKTAPSLDPDQSILDDLTGIDLFHAAGHFVADGNNPLFSALPLGDLRLRGHDYLELRPPPRIAVLSACASGQGEDVAGAQVGFASAALAAGTSSVIATQTVVEDGPTLADAMQQVHHHLRRQPDPAEALRSLRKAAAPTDRSLIASLTVIGTGWVRSR